MRAPVDPERLRAFLAAFSRAAREPGRLYLVGGASAVMAGWRNSTIDIDIAISPSLDPVLSVIPEIKEQLSINVELASPADFIPPLPGWEERSRFIQQDGPVSVLHYDFYAQALAKLERGHRQDLEDVRVMRRERLIEPGTLLTLFARIEPSLHRYPAVDPASFRRAVQAFCKPE
jgi:hypothetical protein